MLAPPLPPLLHSGWLHKRGHVNTAFKRRFFVLRGARLAYYEDEAAAGKGRSRGSVTVVSVRHVRPAERGPLGDDGLPAARLAFAFHFETSVKKPFVVYADSMQDKLEWIRVLLSATSSSEAVALAERVGIPSVEDVYREHICELKTGGAPSALPSSPSSPSSPSPSALLSSPSKSAASRSIAASSPAWSAVADGVEHARACRAAEAQTAFATALHYAGHGLAPSSPPPPAQRPQPHDEQHEQQPHRTAAQGPVVLAALYESAKLHSSAREYDCAASQLDAALIVAPPEAVAGLRLQSAWCHWQLGRSAPAEGLYTTLLDASPLCWPALLDRARMYVSQSRWTDALGDLTLVAALGRAPADAHSDRAACLYELGELEEALAATADAIAMAPMCMQAHAMRGNVRRRQGDLAQAIADYDRALELEPHSVAVRNNRGVACLGALRLVEARADLEHALRLAPGHPVATRNLEALMRLLRKGASDDDADTTDAADAADAADDDGEDRAGTHKSEGSSTTPDLGPARDTSCVGEEAPTERTVLRVPLS